MATTRIEGVHVAGIASAVPDRIVTMEDDAKVFGEEETRRVVKNTGVRERHIAKYLCASDLCQASAERLMTDLDWSPESIDVLVFVTQCADVPAPATACLLQQRLKLGTHVAAFDVNLGCSAYTYGLWMTSSLLRGGMRRALLLVGDTATRAASPHDRSVVPLFGDAGSATALELKPGAPPMDFILGTDGSGAKHLHSRTGGHRHPCTPASFDLKMREDGILRSDVHTVMNGAEVLTFALRNVPGLLKEIKTASGWSEDDVAAYVFHQASAFMLKNVARCARISMSKVVLGLEKYGNTSSASIPLAMNDQLQTRLESATERLILTGFGIGWSWAAAAVTLGPMVIPPVIVLPDVPVVAEF